MYVPSKKLRLHLKAQRFVNSADELEGHDESCSQQHTVNMKDDDNDRKTRMADV